MSIPEIPAPLGRCPVCDEPCAGDAVACVACETPHHLDCWVFQRRCGRYACGSRAHLPVRSGAPRTSPLFPIWLDPLPGGRSAGTRPLGWGDLVALLLFSGYLGAGSHPLAFLLAPLLVVALQLGLVWLEPCPTLYWDAAAGEMILEADSASAPARERIARGQVRCLRVAAAPGTCGEQTLTVPVVEVVLEDGRVLAESLEIVRDSRAAETRARALAELLGAPFEGRIGWGDPDSSPPRLPAGGGKGLLQGPTWPALRTSPGPWEGTLARCPASGVVRWRTSLWGLPTPWWDEDLHPDAGRALVVVGRARPDGVEPYEIWYLGRDGRRRVLERAPALDAHAALQRAQRLGELLDLPVSLPACFGLSGDLELRMLGPAGA